MSAYVCQLRLYAALLSSVLLIPTAASYACSGGPPLERAYVTYFDAALSSDDASYKMCYIDADLYNPEWDYYDKSLVDRYQANLIEWQRYAENKPALADIADIIYELDPEILKTAILQPLSIGKSIAPPFGNNLFVRQLVLKKDISAIKYFVYSRECEPHIQAEDMWEPKPRDKAAMQALIERGIANYNESASEFLRLRYGFQVVRLAHYMGNYDQALTLYDKLIQPLADKAQTTLAKESQVLYWAMALKAGALKQLRREGESLYYFSRVFAANPDKRDMVLLNCRAKKSDWEKAIAMAKTPQEKIAIWTIQAATNSDLSFDELKAVCQTDAQSAEAQVLLLREINKIERNLLSPYLTQSLTDTDEEEEEEQTEDASIIHKNPAAASLLGSISDFFSDIWEWFMGLFRGKNGSAAAASSGKYPRSLQNVAYIRELRDFVAQTADAALVKQPALWHTAAAYLSYLSTDYTTANQRLDLVRTTDKSIVQQADLVRGLTRIATQAIDADTENDFYRALSGKKLPADEYNNYGVPARALAAIAQQYLREGNVAKAALCFDKAQELPATNVLLDSYATLAQLDELLALAEKTNKSAFERYLFKDTRLQRDVILDIQGTRLMRKGDYAAALKKYEAITPRYWTAQPENEYREDFTSFETNFDESPLQAPQLQTSFNKLTFARKVTELQQKAAADSKKAATYYYQLGNGFYGSPYWGYNDHLWQGNLLYTIGYGDYVEYPLNLPNLLDSLILSQQQLRNEYGKRDHAFKFYAQAVDAAQNDTELAAQAAYMAQDCPFNPFASFHSSDTTNLTYAKLLQKKFSQTAFIRDLIKECATARDFMRR